ncbi:MAG: rod shape-determining protein RodA [Deltaproteobacteria bacterium]|nr:rod shape-determining protein RodA [Deltaproteobacteria bacterium]
MFDRRLLQNFDWILLLLLIIIGSISLINLYSATFPIRDAGGSQIVIKQTYWYLIGFAVLLMMTTFDYHKLERLAWPIYLASLLLLVLVLIIGKVSSGSQRWLSLGVMNFQPSELAKISIVIILSQFFSTHGEYSDYRLRDLWQPFILILLPFLLILKEPDLGSAMVLAIIAFSITLIMKIRWTSLLFLIVTVLSSIPFVWFTLKDYQKKRIFTFLNPESDPLGAGYHIIQSKIAVGSGLLGGKGFLKGTQTRLHFLPEQHTDFAFSVLAEEWGFFGSTFLLILYLFLILWGINIAKNSKDRFGSLLAIGITAIVFWQVVINVCMTIGLMPVVGIPLVLFSYGGSSILSTMLGMGLLMNISMRRFMFQ